MLAFTIALTFSLMALAGGLLVHRQRLRQTEARLLERDRELQACYQRIHDLGGRLLTAQEAERSRIAGELHDDVIQQLVWLEIQLRESDSPDLVERVEEITTSVRDLSHRLHPVKVQLLGLLTSLRSLVREQPRPGPAVTFTHGEIPMDVPPMLTLCLFRVVQEALQNAAKHSLATEVLIDLRCDRDALVLSIADDGVGFDLDQAWAKGLGLVSIRERVEANGGTVAIVSQPDWGTRFNIKVPLNAVSPRMSPTDVASLSIVNRTGPLFRNMAVLPRQPVCLSPTR